MMRTQLLLLPLAASILWPASAQSAEPNSSSYTIVGEGAAAAHRSETDAGNSQVYVYTGGAFPVGTNVVSFHFLFDSAVNGPSGYITPLLFDQTSPGIYTVIGVGKGVEVTTSSDTQKIPFAIAEGTGVTPDSTCTFGYINALVDANGVPTMTSNGTVDYSLDLGRPGVGGTGTTNDWNETDTYYTGPEVVALGTTFGATGADFGFYQARVYSAYVLGVVAQ